MEECEVMDTYVNQLKEVFDSCDISGTGQLDRNGLLALCDKLHLSEHSHILIQNLLGHDTKVNFSDFKECFVALLSQNVKPDDDADNSSRESVDQEVSPKFTFGRKKYGRRSRPSSLIDDDSSVSYEVSNHQDIASHSSPGISPGSSGIESFANKRPMSPNYSQQPPVKSGRMRDEPELNYASSLPSSDSEPSFESSPVEYLQETWKKLGIGQNGYLNVEELACVCEHIGMEMTDEVVAQLFQKLDCDQDGQISFEEFLQGLFQHGDPQQNESLSLKSSTTYNQPSMDDQISNTWPSGIFSCLDSNNAGSASASSILELWESLELPCPPRLLEELGFRSDGKINLTELTSALEEILMNALKRPVLQLAFATFQNEILFLRQTIDQMQDERRKLRINVDEANARAALLAQEVDDNHAKLESSLQKKLTLLEKKYQEQARDLVEELQLERETIHFQTNKLKQYEQDIASVQEEEAKVKSRFDTLLQENSRLEQELRESNEKCLNLQKTNENLQKELSMMPDLQKRISELESHLLQEQQKQSLVFELEKYKKSNQELKDKIDELALEMENIQRNPAPESVSSKGVSRNHSWLSDYKNTSVLGHKMHGSESSSGDNSDEDCSLQGIKKSYVIGDETNEEVCAPKNVDTNKTCPNKNGTATPVDILLKDMFVDQTILLQKLYDTEKKCSKMENAYRHAHQKNIILSRLLQNMAHTLMT